MTCCSLFEIAALAAVVLLSSSCAMLNNQPEAAGEKKDERDDGLGDPIDVEFTAALDQSPQRYVKLLPKDFDADEVHDLLIGLHGMGSDRWQYATQKRGECSGSRDVAARHGMIFISPDYRGVDTGMNSQAEADMLQIIDMLKREYKIGKVFLTGGSMGGISSLIFSARHPDLVQGVASANGKADWLFKEPYHPDQHPSGEQVKSDMNENLAPEFTPEKFTMPVSFTLGGKDTVVPPDSVRRLHAKLLELGKRDVLMIDRPEVGHETDFEDTVASLEFVIKAACEKDQAK